MREKLALTPAPEHGRGRVMLSPEAERVLQVRTVTDFLNGFLGERLALWLNLNLLDDIPKVGGAATLLVAEEHRVEGLLLQDGAARRPGLADFAGVAHVTAPGQLLEWTNRPGFKPLVTAGQRPVFASERDTLLALQQPDFDGGKVVYLPAELRSIVTVTHETRASIQDAVFSPHHLDFEIECGEASLVVIAQTWYPAWRAYVDDRPVPLWRANHAFQALAVPAGRRRVRLRYEDRTFRFGFTLSLLTVAGCAAGWWNWRPRRS
jgi:hypothetical protein